MIVYINVDERNMENNQIRRDYFLNRRVVIAKDRKKRPTDFIKNKSTKNIDICPFCPGNENMTPPASLVYLLVNGEIIKKIDIDVFRHKNWLVRVVPNAYPAFKPPTEKNIIIKENTKLIEAIGYHEVIIESPCHNEHLGSGRISQMIFFINAIIDRFNLISRKSFVKHITIFRNHGKDAGASLSHPHTQLIATPFIPELIQNEMKACEKYWNNNNKCLFCDIIKKEKKSQRLIFENKSFIVIAPWASINPLEYWILPKQHQSNISSITKKDIKKLAETMRLSLGGLRSLLNDPPYNFGLHTMCDDNSVDYYHWHLEVYPRLAIWAGFEKSTGVYINTISPEDAAMELKEKIRKEKITF